jgi:hypothetical protein
MRNNLKGGNLYTLAFDELVRSLTTLRNYESLCVYITVINRESTLWESINNE